MKKFKNLAKLDEKIGHFISSKKLGNQALHTGDDKHTVLSNREMLSKNIGVPLQNFTFLDQTHQSEVLVVSRADRGKGAFEQETAIFATDGVVTKQKGQCLVVLVADCVPILLFDKNKKVVAAVHSGWKGTVEKIVQRTVEKMKKEFKTNPKDIIVGIGPAIGPCCFEVQEDVFSRFESVFFHNKKALFKKKNRLFVDLWELNKEMLLDKGVLSENIEILKKCTVCGGQEFFSVRRNSDNGRFAVGIYLK